MICDLSYCKTKRRFLSDHASLLGKRPAETVSKHFASEISNSEFACCVNVFMRNFQCLMVQFIRTLGWNKTIPLY